MTTTEPTLVPVRIDDLEAIVGLLEVLDVDATPDDVAAVARFRQTFYDADRARTAWRSRSPMLDLDAVDAGNVIAGPGAHLPTSHLNGHPTEVAAARRIDLVAGTLRVKALVWLVAAGDHGLTDVELERCLEVRRPTGGNRRGELVKLGLAAARTTNGTTKVTRLVAPHGPAIVWQATDAGHRALVDLGYRIDERRQFGDLEVRYAVTGAAGAEAVG